MQTMKTMMVLGEEQQKNLFGNGIETTNFNGFSCELPNE